MNKYIKLATVICLIGTNAVLFITFLMAFFSGEMTTKIHINMYGEAYFELYLLTIITFLSFFVLEDTIKSFKDHENPYTIIVNSIKGIFKNKL